MITIKPNLFCLLLILSTPFHFSASLQASVESVNAYFFPDIHDPVKRNAIKPYGATVRDGRFAYTQKGHFASYYEGDHHDDHLFDKIEMYRPIASSKRNVNNLVTRVYFFGGTNMLGFGHAAFMLYDFVEHEVISYISFRLDNCMTIDFIERVQSKSELFRPVSSVSTLRLGGKTEEEKFHLIEKYAKFLKKREMLAPYPNKEKLTSDAFVYNLTDKAFAQNGEMISGNCAHVTGFLMRLLGIQDSVDSLVSQFPMYVRDHAKKLENNLRLELKNELLEHCQLSSQNHNHNKDMSKQIDDLTREGSIMDILAELNKQNSMNKGH